MNKIVQYSIGMTAIFLLALTLWGIDGMRLSLAMIILFWTPVYLIISSFPLEDEPALLVSWFFSFGIPSSVIYPLGRVFGSLSAGIWTAWIILVALGVLLQWKLVPWWKRSPQQQSEPVADEPSVLKSP